MQQNQMGSEGGTLWVWNGLPGGGIIRFHLWEESGGTGGGREVPRFADERERSQAAVGCAVRPSIRPCWPGAAVCEAWGGRAGV